MMNSEGAGRADGGGEEPLGESGSEVGVLSDASSMSARAATAFATT